MSGGIGPAGNDARAARNVVSPMSGVHEYCSAERYEDHEDRRTGVCLGKTRDVMGDDPPVCYEREHEEHPHHEGMLA